MNLKPLFAAIIALSLIALLFTPVAAHLDQAPAPATIARVAVVHQVEIRSTGFNPFEMTIAVGDSVNWTNQTSGAVVLEEGSIYTLYLPLVLNSTPRTSAALPALGTSLRTLGISIPAGSSYSRIFSVAGIYHFYLQGHPNQQFLLTVSGQTDLEARTVTLDPNPAAKDSPVNLTTDIYNLGTGDAAAFSVSWKILPPGQTTPVDSGSWDVTSLVAGGHTSLNTTFTPSQAGPFTLEVTADPTSALSDADPANNTKAIEFGVTGRLDYCGDISLDTTWTYATYVLTCSVNINSGATLTVSPGTIVKFQSPYSITVNGTLNVLATQEKPAYFTSYLDDTIGGDTNADGSASSPAAGDWNSIIVSPDATVTLTYANIRYGGFYWCGVDCYGNQTPLHVLDGGSALLDHVSLASNGGYGIHVNPSSTSTLSVTHSTIETSALSGIRADGIAGKGITITDNTFTGNGAAAVSLAFSGGSITALDGNNGSGNLINGIQMSGTLGMDTTLPGNSAFAYVVDAGLTVDPTRFLILSPGVIIKFGGSTNGTLMLNGLLVASGTEASPVVFTSIKDDTAGGDTNNDGSATTPARGDWNSIIVSSGSAAHLIYADIRYGGYYWCGVNCYGNQALLHVLDGGSTQLDHAALTQSSNYGIYVSPSSTSQLSVTYSTIDTSALNGIRAEGIAGKDITITDNNFTGNGAAAVSLAFSGGSITALDGNTGSSNAINGIQLSGNLGMDTTLPGNSAFAYVVDAGLTVDSTKTLTLSPGVVVKFGVSTNGTLTVNGSLVVNGTEPSPVIFTAIKDDTAGGDTNNDGSATTPARGDWNTIVVSSGASISLAYADIRYGGFYWCGVNCYGYNTELFLQGTASAALSHTSIHESNGHALSASGNSSTASLTIEDSTIAVNNSNGIDISNSGTYTLSVSRTVLRYNTTGFYLSGSSINATVNHCNIYSNSSLGLNNATASTVDATNNWWGSDTGPAPYGTGNGISGNVTVSPWLTAAETLP